MWHAPVVAALALLSVKPLRRSPDLQTTARVSTARAGTPRVTTAGTPRCVHVSPRCAQPVLGILDWLNSVSESDETAAATELLSSFCRTDGWLVRCEIGADVARAVGGSSSLAKGIDAGTAVIEFALNFEREFGYDPAQGAVNVLRTSRFLVPEQRGFWQIDADDDDGVPETIQWRLTVAEPGIRLGEQQLVPPGPVYFNARCSWSEGGSALTLGDGRLTVKEDLGSDVGIFRARGILAEFKIVGTFECKVRAADL